MIYLYCGTPRSGKSLHTAVDIVHKLRRGQDVIANFIVNDELIRKKPFRTFMEKTGCKFKDNQFTYKLGKFTYKDNPELTVPFLVDYAKKNHKYGKEGQTLLVIDECSVQFNPRDFKRADRDAWVKFFQHHGKLGYNVILISQSDGLIDKQIRAFIEYKIIHRKVNNFKIGWIFSLFHIGLFIAVTQWYGVKEKCGSEFFRYRNFYSKIYDSYKMFDDSMLNEFN